MFKKKDINVNKKLLFFLEEEKKNRPFLIIDKLFPDKKVIHSIERFIYEIQKKDIKKIILKPECILLISPEKVYCYKYGIYIKNMEKL